MGLSKIARQLDYPNVNKIATENNMIVFNVKLIYITYEVLSILYNIAYLVKQYFIKYL